MRVTRGGLARMSLVLLVILAGGPTRSHDPSFAAASPEGLRLRGEAGPSPHPARAKGSEVSAEASLQEEMEAESPEAQLQEERPRDPHVSHVEMESLGFETARVWQLGPFNSIQVNIDARGNNILGDAANEPSLAVNPKNPAQIVVGWRQFDSINSDFREAGYSRSVDGGTTWAGKQVLDEGVFRSDPVLGADLDGTFYYFSLTVSATLIYHVDLYRSRDGGATWLPPVEAKGGDKQWFTVDATGGPGSGNLYENWNGYFGCCGGFLDFARSVDGGESFEEALFLPGPKMRWGTLDVGPDGTLYMAGVYNTLLPLPGHVFARSPNVAMRSETPRFDRVQALHLGGSTPIGGARVNPIGLIGQVWIAADRSNGPRQGNVYLLATIALPADEDNDLDVVFLRSEDGGLTWSPPRRVNDDPVEGGAKQWFGTMSVAPNGRIDVIWNDTRNDPDRYISQVFYSFSTDGGVTWRPNRPVTLPFNPSLGYPHNAKIGDYYHMVSDNGGASLAFAATFNGEQDVYFLRLPVDCNENGVEDACEVSCSDPSNRCHVAGCGTGSDRNGNGVLDACENRPPIADAGAHQVVECSYPSGADVVLDGSGSSDPDQNPLSYTWTDEQGRSLGTSRTLSIPLSLGSHTLTLLVDDGMGGTASDEMNVLVRDTQPPSLECAPGSNPGAGFANAPNDQLPAAEAGFLILTAADVCSGESRIFVSDARGSGPFGPFPSGTRLKITKAPGGNPGFLPMGKSTNGSVVPHLRLLSDPEVTAVDASSNASSVRCKELPPFR